MIEHQALKYDADDINTDVIWPGKYTYLQIAPEEMPKYAMATFDPLFPQKVTNARVLVVGKNFGCGSSREQASECLLHSGVLAVISKSFARIFYRNSINLGLPVIECPDAVEAIQTGDTVAIELEKGYLEVMGQKFEFSPFPDFILELIKDGGLIAHIRKSSVVR